VRVVRLEGDQALPSDVALFRARFPPDCLLAVGLGATETGLSCQYRIDARTAIGPGTLPVGYPTQDMAIVILDEAGRDVGRGRTGEIGVRSRYLAVGYWRQPERTRAAFLPDPLDPDARIYRTGDLGRLRADGCLEFLGRRDFRPRIRGQDVDVAEVEAALTRIGGIREAAVVAREDVPGEARLVACVVADDDRVPTLGAVRSALAATLPEVAIPASLVVLDRLPRDGNGKLDRRALAAPVAERLASLPDRTVPRDAPVRDRVDRVPLRVDGSTALDALERELIAVWEETFQRRGIAVTDDFFELGGDSLLAARIALAMERATGVRLSPNVLYAAPDVARLAARVRAAAASGAAPGIDDASTPPDDDPGDVLVPLRPGGTRPPVFCVHDHAGSLVGYADLLRRLGPDQPCYGLRSPGELPDEPQPRTLEELAARHRAAIERVQPTGPYRLCGVCFGGVVAFEIARQLVARGETVALLAIVAVTPYDFPTLVTERARTLFALHAARARLVPRLRYYAARLRGLSASEAWRYLRGRWRQVMPWLQGRWRALARRRERALQPVASPALAPLHERLFRAYVARPLDGRAMLLLSARSVAQYSSDPARDWRPLATAGVDVRLIDAPGGTLLDEPHVDALADAIAASMAAPRPVQPSAQRVSIAISTSRSPSRRARRRSRSCAGSDRSSSAK
jgi:thioesterase domain-containing protein/acyl carrier protein